MQTNDEQDPETAAIILKLKRKGKMAADAGDDQAEGEPAGSASEEGQLAAAEDLFQAIRGRAPSEEEAAATRAALEAYRDACG